MGRQFVQQVLAAPQKDSADGYINMHIALPDGGMHKLGFGTLRKSDQTECELLEWIEGGPAVPGETVADREARSAARVAMLPSLLTFRYNSGTPKKRVALVLPK